MQKVQIKNFGPVSDVSLDVKDFLIFIGPQASGKSTISKTIYFFKSLKDDFLELLLDLSFKENYIEVTKSFDESIYKKFENLWGTPESIGKDFTVKYTYSNSKFIKLKYNAKNGFDITYSSRFKQLFDKINDQFEQFIKFRQEYNTTYDIDLNDKLFEKLYPMKAIWKNIEKLTENLFGSDKSSLYIPAGRNIIANAKTSSTYEHLKKSDPLTWKFLEYVELCRRKLQKDINGMINERKAFNILFFDEKSAMLAKEKLMNVLKAEYRYDPEKGDMLWIDNNKSIKLNYSSSGQQESVWILYTLFLLILEDKSVFTVIEEPESHLYPVSQKEIVDLIGIFSKINNNQVIVTTHSPYILSSINNLMLAHEVGQSKPDDAEKILPQECWLDIEKLGVYFIEENTTPIDIIDHDLKMIKTEYIDGASIIIQNQCNDLLDLEE